VPVRSRDQGGADAAVQDHEVIVGQGRAAAGEHRSGRVERGDPHRTVCGERGKYVTQHVGTGRVQPPQGGGTRRRPGLIGGKQQIPPETHRIVVAAIKRYPARGDPVVRQPFGHERALPPSGRRDHKGQRQRAPQAQHVMQPLALHGVLPEARPEQLGRDHDLGGASHHPPNRLRRSNRVPPMAVRARRGMPDWPDRTR
jgi:hypothetical protein